MTKSLAIECIETQKQFVDNLTTEVFNMAISALKKQEQDRWTLCREELPIVGQRVLVQYKDGTMAVVRCNDAGHLAWFYARMVAWKPAPTPYQEDKV